VRPAWRVSRSLFLLEGKRELESLISDGDAEHQLLGILPRSNHTAPAALLLGSNLPVQG